MSAEREYSVGEARKEVRPLRLAADHDAPVAGGRGPSCGKSPRVVGLVGYDFVRDGVVRGTWGRRRMIE